jgi:hypothetical protein
MKAEVYVVFCNVTLNSKFRTIPQRCVATDITQWTRDNLEMLTVVHVIEIFLAFMNPKFMYPVHKYLPV